MKKGTILGTIVGAALLAAAPFSLQWSQKTVTLSLDSADARVGRPLTPVSVAGVHRRAHRRAAYGTAAAYGAIRPRLSRLQLSAAYGNGYYANTVSPGYGYGLAPAIGRLSGRPPSGDPSRPLALRREPKLSGPCGTKMGMTALVVIPYLVAMASASSWTVLRSAPLARVAAPDPTALLRRKQQIAATRRWLPKQESKTWD